MRSLVLVGLVGLLGLLGACAGAPPQGENNGDPNAVRGVEGPEVKCDPPTTDPAGNLVCAAPCVLVKNECKDRRGIIIYEKTPPAPK